MITIKKLSNSKITIIQKCEIVKKYSDKSFELHKGVNVTICGVAPKLKLTDGSSIFAVIICGNGVNKQKFIERLEGVIMFFKDKKKRYSCVEYSRIFDTKTNKPKFKLW